jgi:hypothetical protein
LDVARDVWTTLQMAHEGSKPVRKAKVEMLEGQLNRFIMYNDETPHEIFNWLKKLVNKERALGSKNWTHRMLTERFMMAYTLMNYNVVALIRQDPAYEKMTSDDVLGRIMNHEMNIQEANNTKNHYKGVSSSKNKILLSKLLTRTRRRKLELRDQVKKKKKRKKMKMRKNMTKMKWPYSLRSS